VPDIVDENHDELMDKLGEVLQPMKEDFISVWMREKCRQCHFAIYQKVWQSEEDDKYHICDDCFTKMKAKSVSEQHPRGQPTAHAFKVKHEAMPEKTEDPDPELTNEHFDTRQAFLSLCQGNHYQFDQLRRAKHSSMMVLYHLHNPDAPKFVHSCSHCTNDIAQGVRYHCNKCSDYDLCANCFAVVKHQHPLTVVQVCDASII
jgi:E1A/CREB-binding protein